MPDLDLEQFRVGSLPSLFYIPDFLPKVQQDSLEQKITSAKAQWTQVSGRRLQNFGGALHEKWGGLIQAPLPGWMQSLVDTIQQRTAVFDPAANHVLLNAYSPGEGIMVTHFKVMPHEDGPVYRPVACILSLGASCVIRFTSKPSEGKQAQLRESVAVQPGSLLVFRDEAYTASLHGIMEVDEDVLDHTVVNLKASGLQLGGRLKRDGLRLSLTVRQVLKVKQNLLKLTSR